ncbi:MAG: ferrous iron transport protein A [Candidatus Lokiarchaeota archaeon]|nr:ferrous iron transport protein A [Candidatus Lokiarchaeota archaeon]MBD3200737.1 ferrous iron transport protein A [Candidatus Lokiarchaeota archaeon]
MRRVKGTPTHQGISLIKCLTECNDGQELTVVNVNSGRGAKMRLANLGIIPGSKIIKKQSAPFRGPVELNVKGTSIVIGRGLAAKINVRCNNDCQT